MFKGDHHRSLCDSIGLKQKVGLESRSTAPRLQPLLSPFIPISPPALLIILLVPLTKRQVPHAPQTEGETVRQKMSQISGDA